MALQVKCEKHDIVYIAADIKIGNGPAWPECRKEWLEDERYPFLVDTNLFCRHIEMDGRQFPSEEEVEYWMKKGEDNGKPPDEVAG